MSNTSHLDDELVIKSVLQVTLDPKDKTKEFTFLKQLHDKLTSVQNVASSFGPPPGNTPSDSLQSILQSALTSLLPTVPLDLIPCENCSKLIPMDQFMDHESLCGIVPASSMHTSVPQSILPPTTARTPIPPPKIDRNLLSSVLQEKLLSFAGNGNAGIRNGGRYLLESYNRANAAIKAEKSVLTPDHILVLIKNDIVKHCKELLLLESSRNRGSSTGKELLNFMEDINGEFMNDFLNKCNEAEATSIFTAIFQELGIQMRSASRGKNLKTRPHSEFLNRIITLTNDPKLFKILGNIVAKEAMSASTTARELENTSVLGAFLVPTSIISPYDNSQFTHFQKTIPNYPQCDAKMIQDLQSDLRSIIRQNIDNVHALLKKLFTDKDSKEQALNWVATFMQLNDARASINPVDPLSYEITLVLSTDGFMINMLYLLLIFCQPFMDPRNPKLNLIVNTYPLLSHRYDFSKQPRLAQFVDVDLSYPSNAPQITFVSEMFFATLYAIHVGLMSTVGHYTNTLQLYTQTRNQIDSLKNLMGDSWKSSPQGEKLAATELRIFEFLDSFGTQLLDPTFLQLLSQFSLLVMRWFLSFTPAPGAEISVEVKKLFMCFPEFFVKDIAEILLFIIRSKAEVILEQADMLQKTIDWCVSLLNVPTLVKSPIIRSKLTTILTEIIFKKQAEEQRIAKTGWGMISSQALQFATVFQENKLAQNNLAYGLMLIYVDVDIIEGLDVDKENFDKYSLRRNIAMLLNDLWQTVAFKQSFKKECKSNHFSKFINVVLNDSIHLLEDSLGRLVDIKQLQIAMADKEEWEKQDPEIKRERVRYYEIQENSSRGFLTLANAILDILMQLTRESEIVPVFMEPHTVGRVGAMLNHFFISLCGPKCNSLKVKNPEKYSFSPKDLLQKILRITLSFTEFPSFIDTMSRDLDYSADVMKQAHAILVNNSIVPKTEAQKFLEFITRVNTNIETIAASTAGNKKEGGKQEASEFMELDEVELEKLYVTQLQDKRFDTFEMKTEDGEKYNHHYASNIQASTISTLSGSRMQRIIKECQMLSTSLPVALASSIFVRADEERMDVLKAIITGPKDSPYSLGCFEFHIFLPPTYPSDAPLCNMETTGNGTVRFNPNLYNCGKVCLSLLGTWHGDQNSKWNPVSSTIHQVLVSIEALIMVEHPYFNEPAYEAQRGTKEGDIRSREYNEQIRLGTLRHAILGQIKNPSPGFEDVIRTHFRLQKDRLLKQCQQWLQESSAENAPKFERSIDDLKRELSNL